MALTKVEAEQLQAAQTNITSVGTLTTLTVDDITINGSTISDAADLTVDVGGNINLDADGGYIILKDGGTTFGALGLSGGNFQIKPDAVDQDIIFSGNDGGSPVTALTLDMSEAGAATFNNTVTSTKFIADQFTSASGDVTFRRGGSSTARLLIESGTTTSGQNFTVSGTTTATTFTDGYVTWNLAQFNRYGAAIELQYTPTNTSTLVKIGGNGSNPTIFNAYSGDASFSGDVGIGNSNPQRALQVGTYGTGNGEIAIASSTTGFGSILFGDSASGTALYDGYLQYQHDDRELLLAAGAVVGAKINSSGDFGIGLLGGTSNPISARLDVVGGGTSTYPTLELVSNTSNTFNHAVNAFNASLTAGENNIIMIGKEGSTKNSGYIGYKWNGAGSDTNQLTFGHWAVDNLMNLTANGNLGIGEESPLRRLSVRRDTGITAGFNDISQFLDTTLGAGGSVSLNLGRANSTKNLGKMAFKYAGSGNNSNALNFGFYDADNLMTLTAAGKFSVGHAAPFSKFQVGSHTFSGSNGMYADSRVGMSNHGSLTGLMLATTYNDANYPDYGLVFVAGPSTSSYNCWNIAPDGPAKGNRLNFHYQAQASNIHTAPRMASLDGSGNFYPVGDVVMAQGKGIQFVNQADFATGETVKSSILDDYEEGTFVPTIGGSGTVGTWTANSANGGFYIKVGRMVHLWINCTGSLSGASGSAYVYGLPFTTASNIADHGYNAVYSTGSLQYWSGAGYDVMGPLTYPGGRTLYFHTYNGYSNGGQPSVTNGAHNLHCCVSYYTS